MAADLSQGPGAATAAPSEHRWSARSRTIAGIDAELARIWASTTRAVEAPGGSVERQVSARTSVLNLVVVARRPELAERAVATIRGLTARHPSRTLVLAAADPDGPGGLDARIEAYCVAPREGGAEMCSESIFITAGGETGQHLASIVAPLLIHDLPVTVWWPGEPPFGAMAARDLLAMADRLVVDGSSWSDDGLDRLSMLAVLDQDPGIVVVDFALTRQARWREAIASTFDRPDLRPALRGIERIEVEYAVSATAPAGPAGATNVVRPLYHAAWLAARLGFGVEAPISRTEHGYVAMLRVGRRPVHVALRPRVAEAPPGTTIGVRLDARTRGRQVTVHVHAHADSVLVTAIVDGARLPERRFLAPRRTDPELLSDALETVATDRVASATLQMAAALATPT